MKRISIATLMLFFAFTVNADFHDWYGVYSIFHYPSNLALYSTPFFDMVLPYAGLGFGNTFISLNDYNHYAVLDSFTTQDKIELLKKFGDPFKLRVNVNSIPFGISIGNFGIGVKGIGGTYGTISKDILDLALNGNELGRTYDVSNTYLDALALVQISLAGAIRIKNVTGGLSVGYLYGLLHGDIEDLAGRFVSDSSYLETGDTVKYRYSTGGKGFATSLSLGGNIGYNTTVSLGLENLFSSMQWTKEATQGVAYIHVNKFDLLNLTDSTFRDTMICDTSYEYKRSYGTKLPLILRVGMRHKFEQVPLTLFLDYEQGFSNTCISSTTPNIALLTQFNPISFFPLRVGLSTMNPGGIGFNLGTGLSFSQIYFDIDYTTRGGWFSGSKGHWLSIASGLRSTVNSVVKGTIKDSITMQPLITKIEALSRGKTIQDVTDEYGRYRITIPEGRTMIRISKTNYKSYTKEIRLRPRETVVENILLSPKGGEVLITILDKLTQKPLSNVGFSVEDMRRKKKNIFQTDSKGKFSDMFVQGVYELAVEHKDYKPCKTMITVKPGRVLSEKVELVSIIGRLRGKLMSAKTGESLVGKISICDTLANLIEEVETDSNGMYDTKLPEGLYTAKAVVEGYIRQESTLFVEGGKENIKDFMMLKKKMIFVFRSIYFETNKADIKVESYPVLDSIALLLKENPTMVVEIGGHTDSRGKASYNQKLSERRAKSVKNYLISICGIDPSRLVTKGYGETQLIVTPERTKKDYATNRRVEFLIIGEKGMER
jgi:outer membrane protein OmpA-like peptidoglycan-associated protein